jgi:Kef-type K+ transport system membrane component KefB
VAQPSGQPEGIIVRAGVVLIDMATTEQERRLLAPAVRYLAIVVVPAVIAVMLLPDSTGGAPGSQAASAPDPFQKLLFALPLVILVCRAQAGITRRLGQPAVIGEIIVGILLGPSFLGWLWPSAFNWLFQPALTAAINVLAQIGIVLFMFLVGHEIDLTLIRQRSKAAVLVSHASIAIPFLSGIVLALVMYSPLGGGTNKLSFVLFLAVSMSITAFPVMARILTDRGMSRKPVAVLALACAAVDDITAWCLLTIVVALAKGGSLVGTLWTVVLSVAFFALMIYVVRPLLSWTLARVQRDEMVLAVLLGGVLLSALATNEIGIHPIFGAFLFGAITPRGVLSVDRTVGQTRGLIVTLLLPLFFVYTGLRTKFGLLGASWELWGWCLLIVVVAMLGKWGGSMLAARASGIGWRDSWALGALMNCRGLTELVVLNIGLELKVITPTVFAMLVVMTLISTMLTSPALSRSVSVEL